VSELPTEDELNGLPLRAIVAYAARCARRVQPLFNVDSLEAEHKTAVEDAIRYAEGVAAAIDARAALGNVRAARAANASAAASPLLVEAARADFKKLRALKLGRFPNLGQSIDPSENDPLGRLWPNGEPEFIRARRVEGGSPTSGASSQQELSDERLILMAEVNESADSDEVGEALANLCYALNAYHVAASGNGLVLDEWEILVPESIPVEAK
jgi:hypothetical protein